MFKKRINPEAGRWACARGVADLQGGLRMLHIYKWHVDKSCVMWLRRTEIKILAEWERNFCSFRNWLNNGMASIKIRNWLLLLGRNRVYEHRQIGSMGRCFVTSRRTNKTTGQKSFISVVTKSPARIRHNIVAVACWNNGTELSSLLIFKRTTTIID